MSVKLNGMTTAAPASMPQMRRQSTFPRMPRACPKLRAISHITRVAMSGTGSVTRAAAVTTSAEKPKPEYPPHPGRAEHAEGEIGHLPELEPERGGCLEAIGVRRPADACRRGRPPATGTGFFIASRPERGRPVPG